jgi:hypothetical protein
MMSIWKTRMGAVAAVALSSTVCAGWLSASVANAEVAPQNDTGNSDTSAPMLSASATPQAATAKDKDSDLFAGYMQKAGSSGFPQYFEMDDTITVPTATDIPKAGISRDLATIGGATIGGEPSGVSGGVEVDTSSNETFYSAIGVWGQEVVVLGQVSPGDVLQVTVKEAGETGGGTPTWLVEIFDNQTGQEFGQTNPLVVDNTTAGAVEVRQRLSNGTFIPLTKTTPVLFADGFVQWAEKGGSLQGSQLMATTPGGAKLLKLTMTSPNGKPVASPSKPSNGGRNFTVTDVH